MSKLQRPTRFLAHGLRAGPGRLRTAVVLAIVAPAMLVRGGDVLVSSVPDLLKAAAQAQPGDKVTMQDGIWQDADILFSGSGTLANPITLQAQTLGGAILSGSSRLRLAGEYLVVEGLKFVNGYIVSGDVVAFRNTPSSVANNCRVSHCAIIDYNPDNPEDDTKWVSVYGVGNRLDHCYFSGKNNLGSTVVVWVDSQPDMPGYHRIDHNYFGPRPPLGINGGETIRVGTSDVSMNPSRTVVENNLFEQCDGDVEILSNKSAENIYRHNTFVECVGALVLRHGNRCVVQGNYFFGRSKPQTGGVRIIGEDHQVYNNYFADLTGAAWGAALSLSQGLTNSPPNGYFQVKRALIAFNTFVNCQHNFLIGLADTLAGTTNVTTLPPVDCTLANNLVLGTSGKLIDQRIDPVNLIWQASLMYGSTLGIPPTDGIRQLDPRLALAGDGLWRPALDSPAVGAAEGTYPFVTEDVEGQPRPSPKDIGCDQLSDGPVTQPPLTSADVGPTWLQHQGIVLVWADPADISYGQALGAAQLNAQVNVPGTFAYTPPAGTVLQAGRGQRLSVTFTANDTARYGAVTQAITINVLPAMPLIFWPNPAGISYGTALGSGQLNATADVPGTFVYTPPAGTVLDAGAGQTLSATFMPADPTNYAVVTRTVPIDIAAVAPVLQWAAPAAITNGTPLGPIQLNATANMPGTFVYSPPAGTVLNPGSQQILSVVFTPTDTANYTLATNTVLIDVTRGGKLIPIVVWASPADLTFGTPLSGAQLNATANVPGTFVYQPPEATVLSTGDGQILTVTFTPFDTTNYAPVSQTVGINVAPAVINATVRVAYLIPANRGPQPKGVASLRQALLFYQRWFGEQMQRYGFGPKTFTFEAEADAVTPAIHVIELPENDVDLRADLGGGRILDSALAAGVPIGNPGQVWWLVPEVHLENANGSITGGFDIGYSSGGSGDSPGWALFGSDFLALTGPGYLTNNTSYDALVLADVGPYPLQLGRSFPWFDGETLSSLSSSALGAGLRELAEAFGLDHDFRNDQNFNGNVLGFGFRGIRGAAYPEWYRYNDTRLPYGAALALNVSPYFNFGKPVTDYTKPRVTVGTSGTNAPINGLLRIAFSAFDAGGLSAALLSWKTGSDRVAVDEMLLSGSDLSRSFLTPYYDPGQTNQYTVSVFDVQGNRQSVTTDIIPARSMNRAPLPFVAVRPGTAGPGEDVVLDASASFDSQHSSSLLEVEWDLDGDGVFDTEPTITSSFTNRYLTLGTRLIRARVTDPAGSTAVSAPVPLSITLCLAVLSPTSRIHGNGATTGAANVTTSPTCQWTVLNTNDWITITSGANGIGSGRVTYGLAANPAPTERVGTLLVGDQLFAITQRGVSCTYSVSPSNRFHGSGHVTGSFKVTTKSGCPWTVSNTNSWITITTATNNVGTTNVTYALAANPGAEHRTGALSVADQLYTITQWGTTCTYVISPANPLHGPGPEAGQLSVAANTSCSWSLINTNDWITITSNANGTGSAVVGYTVAANPGFDGRTGVLTIGGQDLTISQEGFPCPYALSPNQGEHASQSETALVSVTTLDECRWTVRNTNNWITVISPTNRLGSGSIAYRVDDNPGAARTGTLRIGGAIFTVSQDGLDAPFITLQPISQNVVGGAAVVFTVGAAGAPPLAYQWRCNGTNLLDAPSVQGATTATLTLPSVQGAQSGNYEVVVSNGGGAVTSAPPAVLRVNTAPKLSLIPDKIVSADSRLRFTVSATDADLPRQTLTYNLDPGAPAGASIDPATGLFSWTTGPTSGTSTNWVTIRVTDNGSPPLSEARTVAIAVVAGFDTNVTLVATGSVWRYLDTGEDPGTAWSGLAFDDHGWQSGPAGLGYGNGDEATVVSYGPDASAKFITTYFRCAFAVSDPTAVSALRLRVRRDDGVVVYLNSQEMYRDNMPAGPINYLTPAASSASDDGTTYFTSPVDAGLLVAGQNVVAAEIHQRGGSSSDIAFDLELTGTQNMVSSDTQSGVGSVVGSQPPAQFTPTLGPASPRITSQPASEQVEPGATVNFRVAADGAAPLSYQWQFNGMDLLEGDAVSGATSQALTLWNVQAGQQGNYRVVVRNAYSLAISSNAVLRVSPAVTLAEALDTPGRLWLTGGDSRWTGQNAIHHDWLDAAQSGALLDNQTSWLETTAVGPAAVMFWWKVSSEANHDRLRFYINGTEQANISGEIGWVWRTFDLTNSSQVLRWAYSKDKRQASGQDRGWVDQVEFGPLAPTILRQPVSQTADLGAMVTFSVSESGSRPINSQWRFNGVKLLDGPNLNGATLSTLVLSNVQPAQAGTYSVMVVNDAGRALSTNAVLKVFAGQPMAWALNAQTNAWNSGWVTGGDAPWVMQTSVTHDGANAGQSGSIGDNQRTWVETSVLGPGKVSFWWRVSSEVNTLTPAGSDDNLRFYIGGGEQVRISGNVSWQFQVFDVTNGPQVLHWRYQKNSTLAAGQDRGWLDQVQFDPTVPPLITNQPASLSVDPGAGARFNVVAVGTLPLTYQWQHHGINLLNGPGVSGATTATLSLSNVQADQGGTYAVVVGNPAGSVTSSNAFLALTPTLPLADALDTPGWIWTTSGSLPSWLGQFAVSHDGADAARNGIIGDGGSNSMQTTVTGPGAVSFWWKVSSETNNDILRFSIGSSEQARISGEVPWQQRTFPVPSGSQVLKWTYSKNGSVTVGQDRGWVDQVQLTALPPTFSSQPSNRTMETGNTVTFNVAATGTPPLVYRWQFNGVNLMDGGSVSGATTATLVLTNVQLAQAGNYSVLVTGPGGTTASSNAVLRVTPVISLAEALDTPGWVWDTSGSPPWVGQAIATHDGVDAARSGAIGDGNSGSMQTTVTGPGTVSFWWKVSSEPSKDTLRFYVGSSEQARISGEVDWQPRTFSVPSGSQTLKWTYSKNSSGAAAQDLAWVDQVQFSGPGLAIIAQPVSQSVGAGTTVSFNVTASGTPLLWYQWRFNGTSLVDGGGVSGAETATLTLSNVQQAQAGAYSVIVRNASGNVTSVDASLTVTENTTLTLGDAVDAPALVWDTYGDALWTAQTGVTHDGSDAAQSGSFLTGASTMHTYVTGPATVSFWWKVSSETNVEALRFYVGGVLLAEITGAVNWEPQTFAVPAGSQELKWKFKGSGTTGQGRGWVDQVELMATAAEDLQSLSSPIATAITVSNGKVILTWAVNPGKTYQVLYKDSLSDANWELLPREPLIRDSVATFQHDTQGQPQQFYQIMEY